MRPLLIELTAAYSERNPHVQFSLRGGGSRMGEQRLASGQADIAASTAAYPDAEIAAGLVRIPIGLDGIALVVHSDNPVNALTLAQIRALFGGRVLNWEEVGGARDVLLVSREEGSATRELFEERVMDKERGRSDSGRHVDKQQCRGVCGRPSATPSAMSRLRISRRMESPTRSRERTAPQSAPAERTVKAVAVEGRVPYGADLADYQYPLARSLYLLIDQGGDPSIQKFIDFALGEEGQDIVARYHVPIR